MTRLLMTLALVVSLLACASSGQKTPATPADQGADEDPYYSFTLLRQGSVLLQQGRYEEALDRFLQAQQLTPDNATVHNMVGLCHMQIHQLDEAVAAFDRALNLAPSFTDARNNRGSAYLAQGKSHLAEVDFLAVLADTTYPHRWECFYNLGMAQVQQGRLGSAEESFKRAAFSPIPVYEAYLRLAEIAERQGRTDTAVDLLEEVRVKAPERMDVALALGRLLTQIDRREEARPHLDKVIASDPGSPLADEARILLQTN
jgi:Tfp pilus assembly protein PilF